MFILKYNFIHNYGNITFYNNTVVATDMKLLLLSLAIVAFAASDDKREMLLLKRLLNTIEGSETRDSASKY